MDERRQETEVREYTFDDGRIPNNPTLPLLVYSQALYMVDEESESFVDGLLYSAFHEERSFVVQDVAAPLVDGAEDRCLQQAPLVFDQQEVHAVSALSRGALEAFDQTCRTGAGAVR